MWRSRVTCTQHWVSCKWCWVSSFTQYLTHSISSNEGTFSVCYALIKKCWCVMHWSKNVAVCFTCSWSKFVLWVQLWLSSLWEWHPLRKWYHSIQEILFTRLQTSQILGPGSNQVGYFCNFHTYLTVVIIDLQISETIFIPPFLYSHVFISLLFTFHFSASKEKNKQKKTNKQKNKNQRWKNENVTGASVGARLLQVAIWRVIAIQVSPSFSILG